MRLGLVKETAADERRVALAPASLGPLVKAGFEVRVEAGAGTPAGYRDEDYSAAGASIVSRSEALGSDVVACVRYLGADAAFGKDALGAGQFWVGMADPLSFPAAVRDAAPSGATCFSLELIPRTTRAQAMDVLSSQANLAGYKGVLLGAAELDRLLPMMTTAAGTIPPAKVLVLGAGVAGLQAIATARRLGAVVTGYDVRPEVRTQIESLGAKFLVLDLEARQGEGGYAAQQDETFLARQQEQMGAAIAEMDMVVTTAAIPGRKAPILVTRAMVEGMKPGSVVVDLAAERGGNCEATEPGGSVDVGGVKVLGPLNLPSTLAHHASALYGKNVANFLLNLFRGKELAPNWEDDIVAATLLTRDGELVSERVRGLL